MAETRNLAPLVLLLSALAGAASASTHPPEPDRPPRLGRIFLDRDLADSHATKSSFHFLLRYPEAMPEDDAQGVIEVLEAELHRLRAWIPIDPGYRRPFLEVLLFDGGDFEEAYGPTVVGIYDGRLRIPIVRGGSADGIETSTLTHELVHALVTEYTGFAVPFWFQEGLAQYLELDHTFPDRRLLAETEPLPWAFLDEVLTESEDPVLVERAYRESVWAVHFLAVRDGISGIRRLVTAYAEGVGDESAFLHAFRVSGPELERELRAWYERGGPGLPAAAAAPIGGEPSKAEVHSWYRHYQDRVRPVKSSLRQVVDAMQGRGSVPLGESCPRLGDHLSAVFGDRTFFDCPDEDANLMLFEAFRHIEELTLLCQEGAADEMRTELAEVERSLQLTAYLLEPYGLAP